MVDVNTIKPGDKVVATKPGLHLRKDGTMGIIAVGDIYAIANPTVFKEAPWNIRVEVPGSWHDGIVAFGPNALDLVGRPDPSQFECTCDAFKVLMVSGCKCGAFQREREANR